MAEPRKQLAGEVDPAAADLLKRTAEQYSTITPKNFYTVGGKTIPDARAKQFIANQQGGITTEVIEYGMDDERAFAKVRGWRVSTPEHYKEDVCTIFFSSAYQNLVWNQFVKGCPRHRQGGCPAQKKDEAVILVNNAPVFIDSRCMLNVISELTRLQTFGDRVCVTKAEGRVHDKLLNGEWREPEEIEAERTDIEAAARGMEVHQGAARPTSAANENAAQTSSAKEEKAATQATDESKKADSEKAKAAETAKPAATQKKKTAAPVETKAAETKPAADVKQAEVVQGKEEPTPKPPAAEDAQTEAPAKPRKNGERAEALARRAKVSNHLFAQFMARCLDVREFKDAERSKIVALLTALESYSEVSSDEDFTKFVKGEADLKVHQAVQAIMEEELKK